MFREPILCINIVRLYLTENPITESVTFFLRSSSWW